MTPLYAAAARGEVRILRILLSKGALVNATTDAGCALHAIASYRKSREREHPKVAAFLLSIRGIDVNAVDKRGRTPLYYAERTGNKKVAALLRRRGARNK